MWEVGTRWFETVQNESDTNMRSEHWFVNSTEEKYEVMKILNRLVQQNCMKGESDSLSRRRERTRSRPHSRAKVRGAYDQDKVSYTSQDASRKQFTTQARLINNRTRRNCWKLETEISQRCQKESLQC